MAMQNPGKGFFASLIDFSFSTFIFPRIVGILYGIALVFAVLGNLLLALTFFSESILGGLLYLLLGFPLVLSLNIIFIRVGFEGAVVNFRTALNTGRTADNSEYLKRLPPS